MLTTDLFYMGLFYFFAAVAVGSAAVVAFSRDLARAIFMLLFALGAVAAFYAWLGADFLFAVQVLIYVGGILVILIFAMMISQQFPIATENIDLGQTVSGFAVTLLFLAVSFSVAWGTAWPEVAEISLQPTTGSLGESLLHTYLFPFELAGVILLVALIAATMMTRREEETEHENISYDRERDR